MTIPLLLRKSSLSRLLTALFMLCPITGVDASGILDFGVSKYQRFIQEDAEPPEPPPKTPIYFLLLSRSMIRTAPPQARSPCPMGKPMI